MVLFYLRIGSGTNQGVGVGTFDRRLLSPAERHSKFLFADDRRSVNSPDGTANSPVSEVVVVGDSRGMILNSAHRAGAVWFLQAEAAVDCHRLL